MAGGVIALAAMLAAAGVAEAPRCVAGGSGIVLTGIDARHLHVRDPRHRRGWVSTLPDPCPGLDATATIATEITGGALCTGEPVRVSRPNEIVARPCALGPFRRDAPR